jgi:hypothetical protein
MKIDKTSTISIGTLITVIGGAWVFFQWYDGNQAKAHDQLRVEAVALAENVDAEQHAADIELSLQQINLELKLLRAIEERRPLSADELDRKEYLEALREILIAEQRKKVA